jgi:FAD/FMN-containing dehydrogenase
MRSYWSEIETFAQGFYANDVNADMSAATVSANYRGNHDRLVQLKNKYDPTNLFRLNANVEPTV